VPLVAVYPREGTFVADHPFLTLEAPWVSAAKRSAAADFLRFLRSDPVQARLLAAGFRTWQGAAGPEATTANGILPAEPRAALPNPPAKLVQAIDAGWQNRVRQPAALPPPSPGSLVEGATLWRAPVHPRFGICISEEERWPSGAASGPTWSRSSWRWR
jgi:hypothetical protein